MAGNKLNDIDISGGVGAPSVDIDMDTDKGRGEISVGGPGAPDMSDEDVKDAAEDGLNQAKKEERYHEIFGEGLKGKAKVDTPAGPFGAEIDASGPVAANARTNQAIVQDIINELPNMTVTRPQPIVPGLSPFGTSPFSIF
jgi:hypothetical protein